MQEEQEEIKEIKRTLNDLTAKFEDKFDEIFNDSLKAEDVLLAYKLYEKIEKYKAKKYTKLVKLKKEKQIERDSFVLYASYYMLYVLKKLALSNNIKIDASSLSQIWTLHRAALELIKRFIKEEKKTTVIYSHGTFFKGNRLKNKTDEYFKKS